MSDSEEEKKNVLPFHEMGLDDRILKAVAKLGWIEPTLIQVTRWHYTRSSVADPDPVAETFSRKSFRIGASPDPK
jgi:hypothetical protein